MVCGKFYYFMVCVNKHCFLPLLHAYGMKCRVHCIALCLIVIDMILIVAHFLLLHQVPRGLQMFLPEGHISCYTIARGLDILRNVGFVTSYQIETVS